MLSRRQSEKFVSFMLVVLLFFIPTCEKKPKYKQIRFSEAGAQSTPLNVSQRRAPLRVAVAPIISPRESFQMYSTLKDYMAQKLELPVEVIQRGTYAEVNDMVRYGQCDVAFVCGYAYLQGQRDFGMQLLVVPTVNGQPVYYSYLIVPKESRMRSLKELRGKVFAFSDPLSNSGHLVLTYQLLEMGETPGAFFKKYLFTYSHDKSIKAVAQKWVDGAAVDSMVYDYMVSQYPQYQKKVKVIQKSLPYGIPPVVVHPNLKKELCAQLVRTFLTMHQNEQGRKVLEQLLIDSFVEADDSLYDSMRQLAEKVGYQP